MSTTQLITDAIQANASNTSMNIIQDVRRLKSMTCVPWSDEMLLTIGQVHTHDGITWYEITDQDIKDQLRHASLISVANKSIGIS